MKLAKNVILLWIIRTILLNITVFFIAYISDCLFMWLYISLLCTDLIILCLLALRFKHTRIFITEETITFKSGIIIKKQQVIYKRNICAVKAISTPFMRTLKLKTPIIYCEGITFILPMIPEEHINRFYPKEISL